ncbi:MAG: TetR/AcrR family transcriptional regulator [Actinomycetota bacterium]|nr:TetR/AcrR family transcriptional regulator [Actinomycetota bacterium]
MAEGGLAAVAVEPIAARLGATKGSFYWHFRDREALVAAALALWEERHTEAVIREVDAVADPVERLRRLMLVVIDHPGENDPVVALFRDRNDPRVAAAIERVTRRRLAYVVQLLVQCGVRRAEARRRATLAYAAYVGWWQLRAVVPDETPAGKAARPFAAVLMGMLLPALESGT